MSLFRHGGKGSSEHDGQGDRAGDDEPAAMQDQVTGTALIVAINSWLSWPSSGLEQIGYLHSGPLTATLVIEADGVPKTTVEHSEQVRRGDPVIIPRWPQQGDTVPVLIDRADPSRVRFQWDQMMTTKERTAQMQAQQAQRLLKQAYQQQPPKQSRPLP